MPKKNWTDEERKAFADKMRESRRAKGVKQVEPKLQEETTQSQAPTQAPGTVTLDEDKFNQLMERLAKLEEPKTTTETVAPPVNQPGLDQFGRPVGITQRYSVDPAHYNDPREKLAALKELERYAFSSNYMLDWDVDQLIWESKFGTSFADPKFTLVLYKKMFDEDNQETGKRILIQTGIFFEDPVAAVKEAVQLGLPVDKNNSPEFLEQMRFLRYKQWLMDIFIRKGPTSTKKNYVETVIDNKVVRVEDYSVVI